MKADRVIQKIELRDGGLQTTTVEFNRIVQNPSGIMPTEYKVLILPKKVEDKSAGGIIIPDESKDREQFAQMEGELVAVSPLAFTYHDWAGAQPPKPGDRVLFAKFSGAKVKGRDGVEYRLTNDKDIAAVLA